MILTTDCLCKYKISLRELTKIPYCHLWNSALQEFRKKITLLKYHKGNLEREKNLPKQKLIYNSELITLAIHATILTY